MTANAFAEDKAECLTAGMNKFVSKPIDPVLLLGVLGRLLPSAVERKPLPPADIVVTAPDGQALGPLARALAALPGTDLALGLKTAGGKAALYERVLGMFLAQNRDLMARLDGALVASEIDDALRLVHTLKDSEIRWALSRWVAPRTPLNLRSGLRKRLASPRQAS